jgi:hypothetical protein
MRKTFGAPFAIVATVALLAIVLYAAPQQVTTDTLIDSWSQRTPSTSQGMILWADNSSNPGNAFSFTDVRFFDGTTVSTVQTQGALTGVNDTNAFALGSGASPGDVMGIWRRDTDFAWVWTRLAGGATTLNEVTYTNPINPAFAMNPEAAAVADGCVFLVLQAGASKHVFSVNPATGNTTILTGGAAVPGAARVTTSQCKAAWTFDDGGGATASKLQFYNGSLPPTQVDQGEIGVSPVLHQGKLVYWKKVSGIQQIFLYDSTAPSPAPVQLSNDATGLNDLPRTDGRHVAWVHREADGVTWNVVMNGGVRLTNDASTRPQINVNEDNFFQLQRGQLLWKDTAGNPRYYAGGRLSYLPIAPATSFDRFWLADGFIAMLGTGGSDAGADKEVFRITVTPPADAAQPAAPLAVEAVAGASQATVSWDRIVGATSYNLYMAQQPGVTKDNYLTLPGGTKFTGVTSPFNVTGLNAKGTYHFVVTTMDGATEGPNSPEAHASLTGSLTWTAGAGVPAVNINAVAADRANAAVAYLAAQTSNSPSIATDVYKTTDSGATWSPVNGGIEAESIRALAANGSIVIAATAAGKIWRSINGGTAWSLVFNGSDLGDPNKVLFMDPVNPATIYGGNFQLTTPLDDGLSYLVKSIDSGVSWTHLPEPAVASAEQRAYAMVADPVGNLLYVAGNGVPRLAKTSDGSTWTEVVPSVLGPPVGVAADSRQATSLYLGLMETNNTVSRGVYKSTTEGASWVVKNTGLPGTLPKFNAVMADPANPAYLHAATTDGYFFSINAAESWTAANTGLADLWINAIALTGSRRLLAATSLGISVLDVSVPLAAPSISTHPQSQTIPSGQTATMSVVASGTGLSYQWYAGSSGTTTSPIGGATSSGYTTPALTTTSSYWVRVSNSGGSADSNTATITVTVTSGFTDDPLVLGTTPVKAIHINELRSRINAVRAGVGLGAYPYTDPVLTAGTTVIKSVHIANLRTALAEAYTAALMTPPSYTDPVLPAGVTIKRVHIAELRAAVLAIE